MKAKKALAMLLCASMVISTISMGALAADENPDVMPISETTETAPVSTLPSDAAASWAAKSFERWSANGIVKGDENGNMNPDAELTRGELAQVFVSLFGLTEKAENIFADLKGDEWYADAILKCVAAGIMKGDGVNCNAQAKSSRGETMVMFGRGVGVQPDAKPDLSKFSDAASVPDWAAGYLAPLAAMGIVSGGGDGTINATGEIDRASTMSLLDKTITVYVNAPGEYKIDNANGFVIVNVSAKEGEVVISGTAAGVAISAGTAEGKIVAKDLKADTVKVDGAAAVSVEGKSTVGEITANATGAITVAKGVTVDTVTANAAGTITNNGTIKELTANSATKVDNKGTITKADIKADGVVLDGTKPKEIAVNEGTKNPTDSTGKEIPATPDKPSKPDGGYNPGPSYTDMIWVRPDGPAEPGETSYKYSEKYAAIGATVSKGTSYDNTATINVDVTKLAAAATTIDQQLVNGTRAYVGLQFNTPADADGVKLAVNGGAASEIDLTQDGPSAYQGKLMGYFPVAVVDGDKVTEILGGNTYTLVATWFTDTACKNPSSTVSTTFTVKRVVSDTVVSTGEALTSALAGKAPTITLGADITTANTLLINRPVTLNGNGKTITGAGFTGTDASRKSTILVGDGVAKLTDEVVIKNLTVVGPDSNTDPEMPWDEGEYGIKVFYAENVELDGVTVTSANAGIQVNSSDVTLNNVNVSGNQFGGIEVAQGVDNLGESTLTVTGTLTNTSEADNKPTVWMDAANKGTITDAGKMLSKYVLDNGKVYYFLDAAKSGAEAVVDGVCYKTFSAAMAEGGTVKLLKDIKVDDGITIDSALTLDLAGKTLTLAGVKSDPADITCDGTAAHLTLKDSEEGGMIKGTADTHKGAGTGLICLDNGAKMTMESGSIKADFDSADMGQAQTDGGFAVTVFNDCTFTMTGGTITAGWYAVCTNGTIESNKPNYGENAKIYINGGTLISTGDYAIYAPAKGGVTEINGGTIKGAWGAVQINNGVLRMADGDLFNTGATVGTKPSDQTDGSTPDDQTVISAKAAYGVTTVTISGGSLTSKEGREVITKGNNATVSVIACTSTHSIAPAHLAPESECTGSGTSWTVAPKQVQP